jgi:hypothetical protein
MKQCVPELETLDFTVPLPEIWKGALGHIGPVQTVTKQVDMLAGKTTCGTITFMAGVVLWGASRLDSFTKTEHLYKLVEASFAWQFDWRYFNAKADPYYAAPNEPIQVSALLQIDEFLRDSIFDDDKWNSFYQPIMNLSHLVHIVRYLLPNKIKRKEFKVWLEIVNARLNEVATAPDLDVPNYDDFENEAAYDNYCAPRRGNPLPPTILNLEIDIAKLDLDAEARKFLSSLDYTKNQFLRTPEEMKELGFVGEPYTN